VTISQVFEIVCQQNNDLKYVSRYLSQVDDESEISELANSVHPDEDVFRLDIHVDQVVVVQMLNGLETKDQR
jgi:hypothetical protein